LESLERIKRINSRLWVVLVLIALIVCCPVSSAISREPTRICVNQYGDFVGGEPGEDPHLRVKELDRIICKDASETVTGISEGNLYPIETFGGECFDEDSRVRDTWMIIFKILHDVLLR
jgi:hypothetical protein